MVSIIILSYNTKKLLQSCLQSIVTNLHGFAYEIIVVDNASHDDSVAMVRKEYQQVTLVANKENAGFAKGINIGAAKAKGDLLLLLNSDIEVLDDQIKIMVSMMEKDKKIGVMGGMLMNSDETQQRSFGKFYSLKHVFFMLFTGEKGEIVQQRKEKGEVDWVSGGFMLIQRNIFDKLGGLDEHFFMYVEDMEFCYRVKKHGYKVMVDPNITIKHVGHASSNRTFAIVNIYKGILYFYQKHRSKLAYSIVKCMLWLKAVTAIAIGRLTHNTYLIGTYREALDQLI